MRAHFLAITTVSLSCVIALILVGCSSVDKGTAILPSDPLCGIFPVDQIAAMLPGGTYEYVNASDPSTTHIAYAPDGVGTFNSCDITRVSPEGSLLSVYADEDIPMDGGWYSANLALECHDPLPTELIMPRVGILSGSGVCGNTHAWALYWGGERYDGNLGRPWTTLIEVQFNSRQGRDGPTDATALMQMVLDFIDRSYAATPPSNPPETGLTTVPPPEPLPHS